MNYLKIKLPDFLYQELQKITEKEKISLEDYITSVITEKIAINLNESYLQERAKKGSKTKYQSILAKVPNIQPEFYDKLPD